MVSVIIPAYNCEKYILRAVDSVFNQTYSDIELIIVNDGSTDGTGAILKQISERYADRKIEIIETKNNGVSAARNIGISKARGEFLAFLDSDDWLDDNAIEALVLLNTQNPKQTISTNIAFIPEELVNNDLFSDHRFRTDILPISLSYEESLLKMSDQDFHFQTACSKLFRMDIIRAYNLHFDEDIAFGEDGLFVYRYLLHTNGALYYDFMILNVVMRKGSATRARFNPRWFENAESVQRMIDLSKNFPTVVDTFSSWKVERLYIVVRRYFKESLEEEHYLYVRQMLKKYYSTMLHSDYGLKSKLVWTLMIILPRKVMGLVATKFD